MALQEKRSVLDAVLQEANDLQRSLSAGDSDKLDEYFQSIRDIETRLSKDEKWLGVAKPKAPLGEPGSGLAGEGEVRVMYDLLLAALQTDSTRVVTYRQPISALLASLCIKVAAHVMSHYSPGERMDAFQKLDAVQSRLLAELIDKLKAAKEPDGSSLFDHTALVYGSNLHTVHYPDNCPTLLVGGIVGIKRGQHLVLAKNTPLCTVWLTLLRGIGSKPSAMETARAWSRSSLSEPGGAPCNPPSVCAPSIRHRIAVGSPTGCQRALGRRFSPFEACALTGVVL